jgi:tRNA 2-selenouridine synthase
VLLTEYYDPMYDYQLEKKRHRICFKGSAAAVLSYFGAKQVTKKPEQRAGPSRIRIRDL